MKTALALFLASLAILSFDARAEPDAGTPSKDAPVEFEQYQLVLLKRGPKAKQFSKAELEKLQAAHLGHLEKMWRDGKMVVAGPFGDQKDESLRGMCLYRVGSIEEARRLAEADPMVKAGRLTVEAVTWYVEKDVISFPRSHGGKR